MRYTIKDLRAVIADCNSRLEGTGYTIREQGRNGYQAADLYKGGDCLRNVGCGTSREVAEYCRTETANLLERWAAEPRPYRCACGATTRDGHARDCHNAGPYSVLTQPPEGWRLSDKAAVVYAERLQIEVYHWFGPDGAERAAVVAEALNKYEGGKQ